MTTTTAAISIVIHERLFLKLFVWGEKNTSLSLKKLPCLITCLPPRGCAGGFECFAPRGRRGGVAAASDLCASDLC